MLTLRPYQREAVDAVYAHLRQRDDNPVVVIPTGGGKTPVMATLCDDAVSRWHGRVLVLAHVKELLEQTAGTLDRMAPQLHLGLYSAGLKRRDTEHPVIVAGIQSVFRRATELDAFDLVIVDEAHMIPPEGEGMYQTFLREAKVVNPHLRVVGLTATPFRMTSGMICQPDHFLNHVCFEVGVKELIRDGYLCPLRTKAGTTKADTSGLHVRGGEFIAGEVEDLMDQYALVRSACAEIIEQTPDALSVLVESREEAETEYARAEAASDAVGTTVWGRVSEQARKLALLHAISTDHRSPTIGVESARWATTLVSHLTRRMLFQAQSHVAENPFHAECLKLMQKLRDAPGREMSHSALLKRMKIDARRFMELIDTLVQRGDVEVNTVPRAGSYKRSYRLRE